MNTLGELQIHILTEQAGAIAEMLKDADWNVRAWAIKTLGNMEQAVLAEHTKIIAVFSRGLDFYCTQRGG